MCLIIEIFYVSRITIRSSEKDIAIKLNFHFYSVLYELRLYLNYFLGLDVLVFIKLVIEHVCT